MSRARVSCRITTDLLQAYLCKTDISGNGKESPKILEPKASPKVIYKYNSLEFGKA